MKSDKITERLRFLKLISNICPSVPLSEFCKEIKPQDFVIMEPHAGIITAIDDKKTGVYLIYGKRGSGKTYGIGYYLLYTFQNKTTFTKKPNYVVYYDTETHSLRAQLPSLNFGLTDPLNRETFENLNAITSPDGVPATVHFIVDSVNDKDTVLKLIQLYTQTLRMALMSPNLKLYILTSLPFRNLKQVIDELKLVKINPVKGDKREIKSKHYLLKNNNVKLMLSEMGYEGMSVYNYVKSLINALSSKFNLDLNFMTDFFTKRSDSLLYLFEELSIIPPQLLTENLQHLVSSIDTTYKNMDDLNNFLNNLSHILSHYSYYYTKLKCILRNTTLKIYSKEISKRLISLFLNKVMNCNVKLSDELYYESFTFSKCVNSIPSVAVNLHWSIPMTAMMMNDKVYILGYVQKEKQIDMLIRRSSSILYHITGGKNKTDYRIIAFYPISRKRLEDYIKELNITNMEAKEVNCTELMEMVDGLLVKL